MAPISCLKKLTKTNHRLEQVRAHPETGRPSLYLSPMQIAYVTGLPDEESAQLLKDLNALVLVPEYQCRFKWETNSLAMWDNRCVQHYGVSDYWPARRVVERVNVAGTAPIPHEPSAPARL